MTSRTTTMMALLLSALVVGAHSASPASAATSKLHASSDKKALDTATRDFVLPLRGCSQVVEAFVGLWNIEKPLSEESKMTYRIRLLSYLYGMRRTCREARAVMLQASTSGFAQAGKDGRRAFGVFLSGMGLFKDGMKYRSEPFFNRARSQFAGGQTAFRRAMKSLNGKRAAVGLGPLPLRVR